MKKVEIFDEKLVSPGFLKIIRAKLRYKNFDGTWVEADNLEKMERGHSVAALIWNKDTEKVVLIEQFRYPTYQPEKHDSGWMIEVVAGMIDKGEEPQVAARRELIEEIGYQVDTLEYIDDFYVSPGGSTERIFLYYAEVRNKDKIAEGGGVEQEDENVRMREYSLEEISEKFFNNEFQDAKTIIALMWWFQNKHKE